MAMRACMNAYCGTTSATQWKKGWQLGSGGFANLCDKCGSAYEQLIFCDKFHLNESGWRECNSCGKRAHCGCIASKSSLELLDSGGVECLRCAKNSEPSSSKTPLLIPSDVQAELTPQSSHRALAVAIKNLKDEKMNQDSTSGVENVCELRSTSADCKVDEDTVDKGKLAMTHKEDITNDSLRHIRREQATCPVKKVGSTGFSDINQVTGGPQAVKHNDREESIGGKDMDERLAHPCLKINLGISNPGNMVKARRRTSGTPSILMAVYRAERRENKVPYLLQQGQRSQYLLPKPPKASPGTDLKISKDEISELRVPIPPGEGRGQSQLLPRYWPRITDQELQQISGEFCDSHDSISPSSNSRIVPLFEKVMSASDASRIGRLVLPKACAEAYFPPISQPEGLAIKIQDAKGKDWHFQFRFWPNNNSRMYVLEGVTPWIQSMQLQAGDTVIFSRREPEGKLVMGFRKASNPTAVQDTQVPSIPDGAISQETFYSGVIKNLPIINGYPALLQSLKGNTDPHFSAFSQHLNSSDRSSSWLKTSKSVDSPIVDFQLQPTLPEMKRSHTIGSKSKRLHIDTDDALELMLTWEEAQDLLQPPPSVKPRIVVIEDQELEEYEEPPVFGKKTIFTSQLSGSSCSAPEELSLKGLDILLGSSRDSKRRKNAGSYKSSSKCEASGLNAVAMTAVLSDAEKHQPGCTCIACIRPPNGQNPKDEGPKHERSCMCNVCMTARFRCQALKVHKKTQSELEVESAIRKEHVWAKDDVDRGSASRWPLPQYPLGHHAMQLKDSESGQSKIQIDRAKLGKGQIDLKCHPERKEDPQALMAHVSKMSQSSGGKPSTGDI